MYIYIHVQYIHMTYHISLYLQHLYTLIYIYSTSYTYDIIYICSHPFKFIELPGVRAAAVGVHCRAAHGTAVLQTWHIDPQQQWIKVGEKRSPKILTGSCSKIGKVFCSKIRNLESHLALFQVGAKIIQVDGRWMIRRKTSISTLGCLFQFRTTSKTCVHSCRYRGLKDSVFGFISHVASFDQLPVVSYLYSTK